MLRGKKLMGQRDGQSQILIDEKLENSAFLLLIGLKFWTLPQQ